MAAMLRSSRLVVFGTLLVAALAASCSGERMSAGPSGEVVLYTSMPDAVVDRLAGVVEQRFPDLEGNYWFPVDSEGITLRIVRGRTADIEERIDREIGAGGLRADMIWLAEPSAYETYKQQGVLARYEPPADAPIPDLYVDRDGFYVAGRVISMVLAWNTTLRTAPLEDWWDLTTVAPSAFPAPESGAARATIKALIDEFGWEYFTRFAEQGGVSVPSNGDARDGLVNGTFEAVAVLDYMAREAKAAGSPVDFVYPSSGTVLIPSPIAVTANASNPAAASAVADFLLSQPGQQIIVEIGNFYPVRSDVAPPAGAPSLGSIATLTVDWEALPGALAEINDLWAGQFGGANDAE
jgi:iron(III) transport system substrate-binding protein